MTLAQFLSGLLAFDTTRWRVRIGGRRRVYSIENVAAAAAMLGDCLARGEAAATATARISAIKRHLNALTASGQLANFQSITGP